MRFGSRGQVSGSKPPVVSRGDIDVRIRDKLAEDDTGWRRLGEWTLDDGEQEEIKIRGRDKVLIRYNAPRRRYPQI